MLHMVEQLTDPQITELKALYDQEWWCQNRSEDEIRIMLQHSSLVLAIVSDSGELLAFCRILTDFIFRATLYDVIVRPDHRGRGLGKRLLESVTSHPRLRQVRAFGLCCEPDMIPFYQRWGFQLFNEKPRWMIKRRSEG